MEKNPSGFRLVFLRRYLIVAGLVLVVLLIGFILLRKGPQSQAQVAPAATLTSAQFVGETPEREATSTQAPLTPTPRPTVPPTLPAPTNTPAPQTPTSIPATVEASPPQILREAGFQIRCLPYSYQLPIHSPAIFSDVSLAIQKIAPGESGFLIQIPVRVCGVFVTFDQPTDDQVFVEVFQGSDKIPWYRRPLVSIAGQENTYFTTLDHEYLSNPPYWSLAFRMKVQGTTQTYWEGGLELNRPFSGLCWEGSVPDPLTLKCPKVDRMEREPHPDMPTFVPGGLRN